MIELPFPAEISGDIDRHLFVHPQALTEPAAQFIREDDRAVGVRFEVAGLVEFQAAAKPTRVFGVRIPFGG